MKFYKCNICHNIVTKLEDSGNKLTCCNQTMQEMIPGTSDGAKEKHVPVYTRNRNTITVTIGAVKHPMTPEHHISWVILETNRGYQVDYLRPDEEPVVTFYVDAQTEVKHIYEYCNIHGLYML